MSSKNIKGITIEIGGDTTELGKALKEPEKQAGALTSELKQINYALKFNPDSVELLAQKSTVLSSQVALATDKLLLLRQAQAQVAEQAKNGDIGEDQYRAFQRELLKTESQLENLQVELQDTDGRIDGLGDSARTAAGSADVLDRELDQANVELRETQSAAGKASDGLSTMKIAFANLVADGIRMAISALKDFTVQGIEYISSLDEVQNVIDTVFGPEGSREIEAWSKGAIDAFGLSELSAKTYASTLGTIIDAMGVTGDKNIEMATTLTQLSADWASFRDMKPEEVFDKIRSGITGETEGLKALGIVMTQSNLERFAMSKNIRKNIADMTQAEITQLRYNYILSQSDKALGDFAKTSDSFHNQQTLITEQLAELSGQFASNFLPVLTEALQTANKYIAENGDTLAKLGTIAGTVLNALAGLLSIIAAMPPDLIILLGIVALVIKTITTVTKAMGGVSDTLVGMGRNALDPTTIKIIALIAALALLLFLILAIKEGTDRASQSLKSMSNVKAPTLSNTRTGYASGTASARRGLAWVGEDGPELVRFNGGEQVYNARQSAAMASTPTPAALPAASGGNTFVLQVDMSEVDEVYKLKNVFAGLQQASRQGVAF